MFNALAIIRSLIIYSLCLPLAIFVGYVLAVPLDRVNLAILVLVLLLPLVPVILRWHHLLLIASWNTSVVLVFITGSPNLWMFMAVLSLLLSTLQFILNRDTKFLSVPSVARPLIFLGLVIVITAKLAGGIGLQTFGSDAIGGK